jgi:hypothetical protein
MSAGLSSLILALGGEPPIAMRIPPNGIFPPLSFRLHQAPLRHGSKFSRLDTLLLHRAGGAMKLLRWASKRLSIEKFDKPNETDGHQRAAEREEAWYREARRRYLKRGNMGQQQDHNPAKTLVSWLLEEMDGVTLVVFGRGDPDDVKTLVLDDSMWEEIIDNADLTERLKTCVEKIVAAGYPCLGLINFPWKSDGPQDFEVVLLPEIADPRNAERVLLVCAYEFRRRCVVIPLGPGKTAKHTAVFDP